MKIRIESFKFRFIIFLIAIFIWLFTGYIFNIDFSTVNSFFKGIPIVYSSAVFICFYIIGTFFIWSLKDILKIIGAIFFGAYISTFLIYISEIINAYIFFKISNVLGKDFLDKILKGKSRKIHRQLGTLNLSWAFLLRIVPIVPYRVLDLSFGLSSFSLKKYLLVVVLGSLPRIFLVQFVLSAAKGFSLEGVFNYLQGNPFVVVVCILYCLFTFLVVSKIKNKFY